MIAISNKKCDCICIEKNHKKCTTWKYKIRMNLLLLPMCIHVYIDAHQTLLKASHKKENMKLYYRPRPIEHLQLV